MGLHSTVYLMVNGETKGFGPDDELTEDIARQIGAHAFVDGIHPYPDSTDGKHAQGDEKERDEGTPPPKAGAGSGRDNWLAYADEIDVEIPKGTQRDAIIQMIADAGKPVDPPQQ